MSLGDSPATAIPYNDITDIYLYIERTFAVSSKTNFFGTEPDSYFILNETCIKDPKTEQEYQVILLEDKEWKKHTIFFKKG